MCLWPSGSRTEYWVASLTSSGKGSQPSSKPAIHRCLRVYLTVTTPQQKTSRSRGQGARAQESRPRPLQASRAKAPSARYLTSGTKSLAPVHPPQYQVPTPGSKTPAPSSHPLAPASVDKGPAPSPQLQVPDSSHCLCPGPAPPRPQGPSAKPPVTSSGPSTPGSLVRTRVLAGVH
jgi:hypothetical protein